MRLGKCNRKPSPSGGRCREYTRRMRMSAQAIWEIALTSACFGGFVPLLCRCNLSCQIFLLLQLCLLIRQAFACHLPHRGRLGRPYGFVHDRIVGRGCGPVRIPSPAARGQACFARLAEACPYGLVDCHIVGRGLRTSNARPYRLAGITKGSPERRSL